MGRYFAWSTRRGSAGRVAPAGKLPATRTTCWRMGPPDGVRDSRALRERDLRTRTEELLTGGYATARRLSRLGSVEAVAQRIVDQVSRVVAAGRVALALHRPADDFLTIVATHGYAMSAVEQIRIQPGDWVIGHVYSKGRAGPRARRSPVHGMAHERRGYRSFSFAAVPIFAGSTTVGVLTATDKRDNSSFNRQDFVALRTMSVVGRDGARRRAQPDGGRPPGLRGDRRRVDRPAQPDVSRRPSPPGVRARQASRHAARGGDGETSTTSRRSTIRTGIRSGMPCCRSSALSFDPRCGCSTCAPATAATSSRF